MADPNAKPTAGRESVQGLGGLEAGAERVCPWVLERYEAGHSVRLEQSDRHKAQSQRTRDEDEVAQPAAPRPVSADEDGDHDDRRAEVRFEQEEDDRSRQHRREWNEHLIEVAHALRVAVDPVRHEHREGELAQLGGLKGPERARVEPPSRPVDADAKMRDQDEQHQQCHRDRPRRRKRTDAPVVDAAQDEQRRETDQEPRGLPLRVVEG